MIQPYCPISLSPLPESLYYNYQSAATQITDLGLEILSHQNYKSCQVSGNQAAHFTPTAPFLAAFYSSPHSANSEQDYFKDASHYFYNNYLCSQSSYKFDYFIILIGLDLLYFYQLIIISSFPSNLLYFIKFAPQLIFHQKNWNFSANFLSNHYHFYYFEHFLGLFSHHMAEFSIEFQFI